MKVEMPKKVSLILAVEKCSGSEDEISFRFSGEAG